MFVLRIVVMFVSFAAGIASAQAGSVVGVVTDAETGELLPGANIVVQKLKVGTVSDRDGRFVIGGVVAGEHKIEISYIGYETELRTVIIESGEATKLNVAMAVSAVEMEALVVTGMRQGQVRALNQQKTSDHIVNVVAADLIGRFPDPNTAEALQRIPGVAVARDQGEGRYVLVRGTEARLTSVMINGDQLPAPEGESRSVALDVVPTDQIASIELNKALTPDMDADGIGGAVNLVTRKALENNRIFKLTMASGFNNLVSDGNFQGAFTYGERSGDGKLGYLFSASHYQTNRGADGLELEWDNEDLGQGDVQVLGDLQQRDYIIERKRTGLSSTIDYQASDKSSFFVRGIYNRFSDQEFRRRTRIRFDRGDYTSQTSTSDSRVEREMKNRYEVQDLYGLTVGGSQGWSGGTVDYSVGYSYADEDEPNRQDMTFEQRKVDFTYDVSNFDFPTYDVTNAQDIHDPANFKFDDLVVENNRTTDKNLTAKFKIKMPFLWRQNQGSFRLGGKLRLKEKDRANNVQIFDGYDGSLSFADVIGTFEDQSFLSNRYTMGKLPDPKKVSDFYVANGTLFELDVNGSREDTDLANYTASEDVYAFYAETRLDFGRAMLRLGARYEQTRLDYAGNEVTFDDDGDYASTQVVKGANDYGYLFPMGHLRYKLDDQTNFRIALTRSTARPNYYDLVPYQLVNREDEELKRGNSSLVPTLATNVDLLGERYFQSVGVISGGFFFKKLTHYIYDTAFDEQGGTFDGYEVEQPVNGGDASLWGAEFTLQQQFTSLPGWLNGFGIYANYTYTDSEANVIGRSDKPTLPGQSKHMANLAVSYEKHGFSGRLALNVHGEYIDAVGDEPAKDVYYAKHTQLDMSLSQEIRPNARIFVELINLTDEPLRFYEGSRDRLIQQEFYSWWGHMGVKLDF